MKRVLAISFLFVFLIAYITPVTSVQATEVIWGDNNSYTWSNDEYEYFRKIAVMSMIPDLLSTGVNQLSIDNANSVDDFVDNIIEFIENNPDSVINVNTWSALNDLNQAIQDKTEDIGNKLLTNGLVVTGYDGSLHSIFEPQYNNGFPKITYKPNHNFIPICERLSRLESSEIVPNPDIDYLSIINYINPPFFIQNPSITYPVQAYLTADLDSTSFIRGSRSYSNFNNGGGFYNNGVTGILGISKLDVYINYDTATQLYYITNSGIQPKIVWEYTAYGSTYNREYAEIQNSNGWYFVSTPQVNNLYTYNYSVYNTSTNNLQSALEYVRNTFSNINLYVNGDLWLGQASNNNTITLDINGIDFYSGTNEKPIQYYYPNGTTIDYQKLYEVIKRAINNNTPITNQTIWEGDTYYDSHDNVYTPNIFNYYSDDDESEDDVLEDIINLAIIPKFDTALLQPIEEPLVNGEKIMLLGVQSLPEDILFVIGAGFVLILFCAMINRLIE